MKRKITVILVLVVFLGGMVNAQNEKDGLSKLNQKEFGTAKQIFSKILKSDPKNTLALYGMGEYYFQKGRIDSAKIFFLNGIEASSSNAYNYVGLGKINLLSNSVAAEANFKDAVKKSKKDVGGIIAISKAYYEQTNKNLNEAKRYVELAISSDPASGAAYFQNGLIEYDKSNYADASLQFERAMHFDPNLMEAYMYQSKIMVISRNFPQAVESLNKAIAVDPKYWPAYKALGELNYDNHKYAESVTNFDIYFKNIPTDKDITHYAYSMFFNKQYQQARDMLDKLIQQNQNDYVLLRLLGYISIETKDLVNGKTIMDKFFTLVPADKILTDDYSYYGKMLSAVGNDSLAIANYNLALKKDSTQAQIYDEISKAYKRLKKYDHSLLYANKYVNKKPSITTGDYYNLGIAYYSSANILDVKTDSLKQLKYYQTADSLFAKVETYSPNSYLGPLLRGRVNSVIDKETTLGLAKPFYEKALEILIKDPVKNKKEVSEVYAYLGFYYYVKNETATSIDYWKKLLEIDPENAKALEALNSLEKKK